MSAKQDSWLDLLDKVSKYRWPRKGDRLLKGSDDLDQRVDFPKDELSRYVHIWEGYMHAGTILIDACETDRYKRHLLIYPIIFNYRHGIELAIKWVIERYGNNSTVEVIEITHHNLWQLWKVCKQIIVEVGSEDSALTVVERVVQDFHEIDPSALSFRYSRNKDGALINLPDSVDLLNIRDVMEGVSNFFDGVDGELDYNSRAVGW